MRFLAGTTEYLFIYVALHLIITVFHMEGRAAISAEAATVEKYAGAAHLRGWACHSLLGHLLEHDGTQRKAGQGR